MLAALRATLAGAITFFVVLLLGNFAPLPIADRILGFGVALFIAATVRDGTQRAQIITIALAPVVAFAAASVASLLLGHELAAAASVPLLMFVVTYAATRGPRYASLGMVMLISYIIGLVTSQPAATLMLRLGVLLLAAAAAALVRLVLLPEHPQAELDRLRRAIHGGINRVLARIAAAVSRGSWDDATRADLRHEVYRLGEVIMLAQARVASLAARLPDQGAHWLHLLTIELATERTARVALQGLGPPAARATLLASLAALQRGADVPPQPGVPLGAALGLLAHVLHEPPHTEVAPAAPPPAVTSGPALRSALQAMIAAALAVTGGLLVSPNRWYWAAFAAFVMFQGTRSRAETIAKGLQFMLGTLAGVLAGMLLATLLSGHELLTMAAIVVAVFLAFQANIVAYGMMIFWITIILGLMFGMMGYFPPDLLLVRLKEAAVGAFCGGLVASLVLVRRDSSAIQEAGSAFLRALGELVECATRKLLTGTADPTLAARILTAEQRFRDVSAASRASQVGLGGSRNERLRRRTILLEGSEQWARELGQIALQSNKIDDPELARAARETAGRIAITLPDLITRLANPEIVPRIDREPAEDLGGGAIDDPPRRAVRLLLRIDAALVHLASR